MELSSLIDIKKISTNKKGVSKSEVSKSEVSKSEVSKSEVSKSEKKTVPGLKKISLSPKMKKRSSKKRHSKPIKTTKPTKDIFQIEQHIQKLSSTKSKVEKQEKPEKPEKPEKHKVDPKVSLNNNVNQENNEKVSSNSGEMKVDKKRTRNRNRNRSRRRSHSKSKRKMIKGRQVKVKPAKVSEDDLATIKKRIKHIRNKSSKEIKEDLREKGIQVSGKSDRLLKDIYFYSKVCNLNIVHEK